MLEPLTQKQQNVFDFIQKFLTDYGIPPSQADIADGLKFRSKTAAADHLRTLQRKGYIKLHGDTPRGIQLLTGEPDSIPIIGDVAAGTPIQAVENIEKVVSLPASIFKQRPTYLLRVRGDSMKDAGILDGDIIAVRKVQYADIGQIVVARINADEVTVKRLGVEEGNPVLYPENNLYDPIYVVPEDLVIEGVFVGLIRGCDG
tara:strand:+ start:1927 stop:2532 length:606 start_codon:yes stop_codon:yes gene_type:complete